MLGVSARMLRCNETCYSILKLQITRGPVFVISGRRAPNRTMDSWANWMLISVIIYPNESINCSIIFPEKMAIISWYLLRDIKNHTDDLPMAVTGKLAIWKALQGAVNKFHNLSKYIMGKVYWHLWFNAFILYQTEIGPFLLSSHIMDNSYNFIHISTILA